MRSINQLVPGQPFEAHLPIWEPEEVRQERRTRGYAFASGEVIEEVFAGLYRQ